MFTIIVCAYLEVGRNDLDDETTVNFITTGSISKWITLLAYRLEMSQARWTWKNLYLFHILVDYEWKYSFISFKYDKKLYNYHVVQHTIN